MIEKINLFSDFIEREFYKPELQWHVFINKADKFYREFELLIKFEYCNDKDKLTALLKILNELRDTLNTNCDSFTPLDFENGLTKEQEKEWHLIMSNRYDESDKYIKLCWYKIYQMKVFINGLINTCKKQIEQLPTSAKNNTGTSKQKQVLNSFESTMSDEQLKILFVELKSDNNKFIHSETNLKQFKAIFRAEAIAKIKPIKWLKYKPQVFYLLNGLIDRNKLTQPESLYKTIEVCFFNNTGKPFKNLKQSYNTFKNITDNCRYSDRITDILKMVCSV